MTDDAAAQIVGAIEEAQGLARQTKDQVHAACRQDVLKSAEDRRSHRPLILSPQRVTKGRKDGLGKRDINTQRCERALSVTLSLKERRHVIELNLLFLRAAHDAQLEKKRRQGERRRGKPRVEEREERG
jgi:hypothetical protein